MSSNFRTILDVRIGVGPDQVPNVVHLERDRHRGAVSRVGVDDDDASVIAVAGKRPKGLSARMIVIDTDAAVRESTWGPKPGTLWRRGAATGGLRKILDRSPTTSASGGIKYQTPKDVSLAV